DFSSKFDFSGELAHIKPEIPKFDFDFEEEIRPIEKLLYDNSFPQPPEELNAEIADTIIESIPLTIPVQDGNSQQEEIGIVTETDDVLPLSIENFADDPEGDIRFLEELLIDDSILFDELSDANFEENPLISRPPPESPDAETNTGEEIAVVMIDKDKFDDDYQIFMFDKVFSLLFDESEDTIFDLGVGNKIHKAFPLPGESSHWQYKFPLPVKGVPTARRMKIPLPGVCTAMMKKLPVKEKWQLH
nr:hypothetical protein [Tanacetum cinerariifolium]